MTEDTEQLESIAVVGLACRFPGANNADEFWQNIAGKKEAIEQLSRQSLAEAGVAEAQLQDPAYVGAQSVLENIADFDAGFFNITPAEAELMDPQQRIFLESCYQALEDAGYASEDLTLNCGVFAGSGISTYLLRHLANNPDLIARRGEAPILWGNDKDYLATMIAYRLNLTGTSININTACSTSLVAISQACNSLLNFEVDIALAGGVRVDVPGQPGYRYQEGNIFSPDGHCRVFDQDAKGTVFADGCGVVVLKRLQDARQDGDHIYAVISGHATNNDGADKVGFSAPSQDGQANVIREALQFAGCQPQDIDYIEAHGTGTAVGDPIEVAALQQVFGEDSEARGYCAIGSVKSNIGHSGAAAGIAGLIKTIKALQHRQLPATINCRVENPKIAFPETAFYVNSEQRPWPASASGRRAGISAFGIGGTNCHMIVEEKPGGDELAPADGPGVFLLPLSAKHPESLQQQKQNLIKHLQQNPGENLADVAYTLALGRNRFACRSAVVCHDRDSAISALQARHKDGRAAAEKPVVFMFSGQGSQHLGMGYALYREYPAFRQAFDACAHALSGELERDLTSFISLSGEEELAALLQQTRYTQPVLFAYEYALAQLYISWGIEAEVMIGHSLGEYVAACLAGVWSLRDSLLLVARRGRLMQTLEAGAMLSVSLEHEQLAPLLDDSCDIAAINTPAQTVVSGPVAAIGALALKLQDRQVPCKRLKTDHAFHSAMTDGILADFAGCFADIQSRAPQKPFISNLTGQWITAAQAQNPDYWVQHLRATVRFGEGIALITREHPDSLLLEIGPGRVLSQFSRQIAGAGAVVVNSQLPVQDDVVNRQNSQLLSALAQVWQGGAGVDWQAFYQERPGRRVSLPGYPFRRQRYWIDPPNQARLPSAPAEPVSGEAGIYLPSWKLSPYSDPAGGRRDSANYLVFSAADSLSEQLILSLREQGHQVVTVVKAGAFTAGDGEYGINPDYFSDYCALFHHLESMAWPVQRLIACWQLARPDVEAGLLHLMNLARMAEHMPYHPMQELRLLVRAGTDFTGGEIEPASLALASACRVLNDESEALSCQCLDVYAEESELESPAFLRSLNRELGLEITEQHVVLRHGRRWLSSQEAYTGPQGKGGENPIIEGGHYVITGALGDIGRSLCDWLTAQAKVHLTLVVRRPLPPQSGWEEHLSDPGCEPGLSARLKFLLALKEKCLGLTLVSADVADQAQLSSSLKAAIGKRPVEGSFHVAGLMSQSVVLEKSRYDIENGIKAKVQGCRNLYQLMLEHQGRFMVLFSSLSAQLGGIGQYEYSAANAYMDGFARQMSGQGACAVVAVNWDRWQQTSKAVPEHLQKLRQAVSGLNREQAFSALKTILLRHEGENPQWIVSTRKAGGQIRRKPGSAGEEVISAAGHDRPWSSRDFVELETDSEKRLASIWQNLMRVEQIGRDDDFLELGGDSLMAVQMVAKIKEEFGVTLAVASLLDGTVLHQIAAGIDSLQ
ncbi:acyltransferase domain-containing protein [Thalassomonas viridans]|uniref:Acyltransferase domain-containing protein n=1 Tax=Thalassomonas viridans TaxID=137584 RepID=A0AAF0CB17_9GAMM|nr:type I polyketide synthase [Thalassomonas viridans]WDE09237.1 acyltransferase domain-containing protein [Thalassomonas viridans]